MSATLITSDKLEYTYMVVGEPPTMANVPWLPQNGEIWEYVVERQGDKIRPVTFQRADMKKVVIEDGFLYVPAEAAREQWRRGQTPSQWTNTGIPSQTYEKCHE